MINPFLFHKQMEKQTNLSLLIEDRQIIYQDEGESTSKWVDLMGAKHMCSCSYTTCVLVLP